MAESVVSSVAKTIEKLLIDEAKFLSGVEGKVEDLHRELRLIRCLLSDADVRREDDQAVGECVVQLRDFAYDAEDIIERYVLRVQLNKEQNIIKAYAFFMGKCACLQVHVVGTEIEGLKSSISNLRSTMRAFGTKAANESEGKMTRASISNRTYAHFEEDFVGREDSTRELVAELLGVEDRVIFILGMGGLGKTSLAKRVISDPDVKDNFTVAWACLSQEYHVKNTLVEILIQLIPEQRERIMKMINLELFTTLCTTLQQKRCLVVVDDIWTKEAWDSLQAAFQINNTGSKLLITTRNKEVAKHIDPHGLFHELRNLSHEESWDILKKRAFPKMKGIVEGQAVEGSEIQSELAGQLPDMKKLGDELLKKYCGGLPLAIIVLGGLLAVNEWKMVPEKSNLSFGDENDVSKVLALSYFDLPWHLKPCFLYLGCFLENVEIPATKVLQMWIAEGFVSLSAYEEAKGTQVEDVAKEYLMELVNRGMVQERLSLSGKIKTYHLHDLMRDLCVSKAMQEGFLSTLPFKPDGETRDHSTSMAIKVEPSRKVRRLSERNTFPNGKLTRRAMPHLRTFMSSGSYKGKWKQFQPIFNHCKFLRVMKLEDLKKMSGNLPDSVGDLVHLRFLSLARSSFEGLPQSMGNLVLLEYLNLDLASSTTIVPNVMWKMRKLRHLHLPMFFEVRKKLRLNTLENIRILRNFRDANCDAKDIGKMTNLRKLAVVGDNRLEIIPQLAKLNLGHLQSSSFLFRSHDSFTQDELNKMLSYTYSCKIFIYGKIERLPELGSRPQQLRKLVLMDFKLEGDPMPILQRLEHLVVLMLADGAFTCQEMVCSRGFPQLEHFYFCWMYKVDKLTVAEGAMPKLSRLGIHECHELETSIRPGVSIYDCSQEASKEWLKSRWLWPKEAPAVRREKKWGWC